MDLLFEDRELTQQPTEPVYDQNNMYRGELSVIHTEKDEAWTIQFADPEETKILPRWLRQLNLQRQQQQASGGSPPAPLTPRTPINVPAFGLGDESPDEPAFVDKDDAPNAAAPPPTETTEPPKSSLTAESFDVTL